LRIVTLAFARPAPHLHRMPGVRHASPYVVLGVLLATASAPVLGQTARPNATLPGAWPLGLPTRSAEAAPLQPLPDRRITIPGDNGTSLLPGGIEIQAGMIGEGMDPTRRPEADRIRPSDRTLPTEAVNVAPAVPGMTLTVPLSP
jgi:hypothetical protein